MPIEFVGPFELHRVVYEGRYVPFLTAHPMKDGRVELVLDRRFSLTVEKDDVHVVTAFVADAIAVALGYTCHPREDWEGPIKSSPFGGRVCGVSLNPPTLSAVPPAEPSTGERLTEVESAVAMDFIASMRPTKDVLRALGHPAAGVSLKPDNSIEPAPASAASEPKAPPSAPAAAPALIVRGEEK